MISISQTVQYINNVACVISVYYALSTDTKPTEGVGNGSALIEMDTSKVYFFDAGNSEWLEWGAESNTESNAASTLSNAASAPSMTRPSLTLGNTLSPDVVEDMPVMAEDVTEEVAEDVTEEVAEDVTEEMPEEAEEELPEVAEEEVPVTADTTEDGEDE